jgi:hypothetical protein
MCATQVPIIAPVMTKIANVARRGCHCNQADARIRTADPFITSYPTAGRQSANPSICRQVLCPTAGRRSLERCRTPRCSSSVEIRRERPPRKRGRNESHPCRLNSWITFRTCDSSVNNIPAISGALSNVFEANGIIARCLVEASFDCFDNRFRNK